MEGVAGLVQDLPEGVGGYRRQAVGGGPQRLFQGRKRPGGRAVGLRGGLALGLAQDALAGLLIVLDRLAAAMPRPDGVEALGVEARDQAGDRIARTPADRTGGGLIVGPASDGEEEGGTGDFGDRGRLGAAEALQNTLFVIGQRTQGIFFPAGHAASCKLPQSGSQVKG